MSKAQRKVIEERLWGLAKSSQQLYDYMHKNNVAGAMKVVDEYLADIKAQRGRYLSALEKLMKATGRDDLGDFLDDIDIMTSEEIKALMKRISES